MNSLFKILIVVFLSYQLTENGCNMQEDSCINVCRCSYSLGVVLCSGKQIAQFPYFISTNWIKRLTLYDTVVHELPKFANNEYNSLEELQIQKCNYITCWDIRKFEENHQHLQVTTDLMCVATGITFVNDFETTNYSIGTTEVADRFTAPHAENNVLFVVLISVFSVSAVVVCFVVLFVMFCRQRFRSSSTNNEIESEVYSNPTFELSEV